MKVVDKRESNIELLRILTICGVYVLHYNNPIFGKAFEYTKDMNVNSLFLHFLETISICAVDLFMIISGFFMIHSSKRKIIKVLELLVQVIIFNLFFWFLSGTIGNGNLGLKSFLKCLLPANYFVILYCTVYLISPYVGCIIKKLSEKQLKFMVILLFTLFSVYSTVIDFIGTIFHFQINGLSSVGIGGNLSGYSVVNFLLCWIIGASISQIEWKWKTQKSLLFYFIFTGIAMIYAIVMLDRGASLEMAYSYCSPFIILQAVLIFNIFRNVKIGYSKIINGLAKAVFTFYLFHTYLFRFYNVQKFACGNIGVLFVHIIITCVVTYLICYVVYLIYDITVGKFMKWISEKIHFLEYEVKI